MLREYVEGSHLAWATVFQQTVRNVGPFLLSIESFTHKGTYLIPRIVNILIFCSYSNVLLALPSYSKAHIYYH